MIPNILVDSVVLQNKPLSNLEIIDAAKKLSLDGFFRGVLLRDTLAKKAKLNECGILNLDSTSGDGTYWVMWLKKARISSISIVLECNFLVSCLHIESHQYFTIANESNKTLKYFCSHLCLFALKQLSLGNNLEAVINYLI